MTIANLPLDQIDQEVYDRSIRMAELRYLNAYTWACAEERCLRDLGGSEEECRAVFNEIMAGLPDEFEEAIAEALRAES